MSTTPELTDDFLNLILDGLRLISPAPQPKEEPTEQDLEIYVQTAILKGMMIMIDNNSTRGPGDGPCGGDEGPSLDPGPWHINHPAGPRGPEDEDEKEG